MMLNIFLCVRFASMAMKLNFAVLSDKFHAKEGNVDNRYYAHAFTVILIIIRTVKPRHSAPQNITTLALSPRKTWNRNSLCIFKGDPPIKRHPRKPPSTSHCRNTNVPLSNIIKSDTAPGQFVFIGYTNNSLEYSVTQIL
jgi:hypothetical protein